MSNVESVTSQLGRRGTGLIGLTPAWDFLRGLARGARAGAAPIGVDFGLRYKARVCPSPSTGGRLPARVGGRGLVKKAKAVSVRDAFWSA